MSRWLFVGFNEFLIYVDPWVLAISLLSIALILIVIRRRRRGAR
jgi:hypothetical protein